MQMPARGVAVLGVATRFVSASIIRCRSAHLVGVYSNSVHRQSPQCGERSNAAFRTQSAAEVTSLAPHDSKARLRAVTNRRDSWRSHVHRTYIAQRVQSFKLQTANVGGRGGLPSPFSGGFKGGILFGKRIPPLVPRRARRSPSRACAGSNVQRCALLLFDSLQIRNNHRCNER